MVNKKINMSRRKALQNIARSVSYAGLGGLFWHAYSEKVKASELVLRPPGALEEENFIKTCIKCGECVNACPPKALILKTTTDEGTIGTPYFIPRKNPCVMCTHIPCVEVCPTGALEKLKLKSDKKALDIDKAEMGVAIIDQKSCVAFWGVQCDACYRACPLIDKAIVIESDKSVTGKHSRMLPVVKADNCTGCGVCEHACITEKASIFILPRKIGLGEVSEHYIKSWEKNNKKVEFDTQKSLEKDEKEALDYLNSDDLLDDED